MSKITKADLEKMRPGRLYVMRWGGRRSLPVDLIRDSEGAPLALTHSEAEALVAEVSRNEVDAPWYRLTSRGAVATMLGMAEEYNKRPGGFTYGT